MSTSNQNNGKKCISNNNSATNTPSNTPVSSMGNPSNNQCSIQNNQPLSNAPKYGTLVPNRIFVGGISASTTEAELMQLFSNYGTVKAAKIIQDRAGVSKGYGFITFESEEEAKRLQRESDNIVLRERKLNIAPAIKKQPFSRVFDASSPPTIAPGGPSQYFIPTASLPFYQSGMTYYTQPPPPPPPPGDMNAQQPQVYQAPTVFPAQTTGPPQSAGYPQIVYPSPPIYVPQQFPYQPVPYEYNYHPNGNPQYLMGNQSTHQPQPLQMPSPGSPPRTPCYNSQLPYNSDFMYYNAHYYGSVDSSAVYQEPVDVNSGNLAEGTIGNWQEIQASSPLSHINSTSDMSSLSDMTRQSATPVVSVLSLDAQQERDLATLQGGRRKKSFDMPSNSFFGFNSYEHSRLYSNELNLYQPANSHIPAYQNGMSYMPPECRPVRPFLNHSNGPFYRNYNNNVVKKTWYSERYRNAACNGNFESGRSENGVDVNCNQEKVSTRNIPPPANNFHYRKHFTRNIQNSNRPSRGRYNNFNSRYNVNNNYRNNAAARFTDYRNNRGHHNNLPFNQKRNSYNYERSATANSNNSVDLADNANYNEENIPTADSPASIQSDPPSHPDHPLSSQITSTSQNCISSARRAKRNVRRSSHMGTPLTEIGAGDAPIPSTDVGDTCKKLDNLKL